MPPSATEQDLNESKPEPSLSLHAEYLPNIRQVSLQISVADHADSTHGLEISLTESRKAVMVSVPGLYARSEGLSETMKLPVRVGEAARRVLNARTSGRSNATMATTTKVNSVHDKTASPTQEYSYRMPVDDEDVQRSALEEVMDGFVPWAAGDMDSSTKLRCRACEGVLLDVPEPHVGNKALQSGKNVEPQPVRWTWKDLPSYHWAEMMDFWHCHKPDEPEHAGDAAAKKSAEYENSQVKGYGASNQVLAIPGTVLVDVATFLVSDRDCKGLKKVSAEQTDNSGSPEEELLCEGCDRLIGVEDKIAKGWRLFKTSVSAGFPTEGDIARVKWDSHPTDLVVAAQLLELIERESARRFVIHCGKKDGLLIWVFNPDMRYSSSTNEHNISSQRALKVFFQITDNVEELLHLEPGETSSLSLEELRLPSDTFIAFFHALGKSNSRLPPSARKFQKNWSVGILHRHETVKPT
ncbi:ubiquitin-conjugating enzyme E2-binding protein [Aspergillus pseudoustus]|uniref:Ubiquitin-conjugating enzyme E2-binding protein n=1 Tax=Aspergillus pseudoustus TaxID=1810923 RepID=A0ABR4KRJ4_9EURO